MGGIMDPVPFGKNSRAVLAQAEASADLYIYDEIGSKPGQISAKAVATALEMMGPVTDLHVYVNCGGGDCYQAIGIYSQLKDHPAKVHMHVTVACSSATFIVMAGDDIEMAENGVWMTHEPRMQIFGTVDDVLNSVEQLRQMRESAINTYAARTRRPAADVAAVMKAQTWMSAAEAKAYGFIDRVTPNKTVSASVDLSTFENVPGWCINALAPSLQEPNMTTANQPTAPGSPPASPPPAPVMFEAKAGFTYRIGDDGKLITEPVASTKATPGSNGEATLTMSQVQELITNTLKAGRDRDREINACCMRAGVPQMAAAFIDDPKITVEMVKDEMITVLCARNVPLSGGGGNDPSMAADPTAKYKKEFAENLPLMTSQGITEEVYVRSRKMQDGVK